MGNINTFLRNINIYSFIIIFVSGICLFSFIINGLLGRLFNNSIEIINQEESIYLFFFLAVIVAPLFETLIFQKFLIEFSIKMLDRLKLNNFLIPILISAIGFGLAHYYSLIYLINGLSMGIVLAYSYSIALKRKESAFWIVTLIHSLVNTLAFVEDTLPGIHHGG
jgi:hypothetical protein